MRKNNNQQATTTNQFNLNSFFFRQRVCVKIKRKFLHSLFLSRPFPNAHNKQKRNEKRGIERERKGKFKFAIIISNIFSLKRAFHLVCSHLGV